MRPNTLIHVFTSIWKEFRPNFHLLKISISLLKVINLRGFKHFKRSRLYTLAIVVLLKGFKT